MRFIMVKTIDDVLDAALENMSYDVKDHRQYLQHGNLFSHP
jgi:hypothetical protein